MFRLLVLAAALSAAAPDERRVDVTLSNFRFEPATIVLRHGERYTLHLANTARGGHDFVARAFFAAAAVDPADRATVVDGRVALKGGGARDIHLTAPAPGDYPVHCSHLMHAQFGMTATIRVT